MSPPELLAALERAELEDNDLRRLLTLAVKCYAGRAGDGLAPFTADADVTATDVVTVVSALLAAQNLEVFELALWQSWGATGTAA